MLDAGAELALVGGSVMTRQCERPAPWKRLGAFLAAGVVLMLAVLAASPGLHAEVHAVETACADHGETPASAPESETCAVELFVAGIGLPVVPPQSVSAPVSAGGVIAVVWDEPVLVSPPHRLPPGCGPPRA